uniref:ATP synthase subunit a n=1 Tax=Pegea confoederata TaxID=942563 RepID=A0AA86IJU3_9UROC|nr:ATP synthase F0 subunit 6 [Pegea confoederata]
MILSLDYILIITFGVMLAMPRLGLHMGWKSMGSSMLGLVLLGMVPLSSTLYSLLPLVLVFSLCLWSLALFIRMFPYDKGHTYYLPSGVPYPLIPLLYILEIISDIIRPVALTVRIVVNLSLGHLFIHGSASPIFGVLMMGILLFELAVAMIQTYIYCSLPSLWWYFSMN